MSSEIEYHGIPPDEHTRKQIFYMLKRISSYTAWNRILGFYKKWLDSTKDSLIKASENGWEDKTSLPHREYITILKGYANFENGVNRLRKGDKRVFQYSGQGDFVIALRISSYWHRLFRYIETGDSYINEKYTPLWGDFVKSRNKMGEAIFECAPNILERRQLEAPSHTYYNEYLQDLLKKMTFPHLLPDIPHPRKELLIPSGKNIPCTGIWEPVTVPKQQNNIWSLFQKPPAPIGPFPIAGTMAYLHGGSHAPNRHDDELEDGAPATWRLLWKDDRYEDGSIPEEEQHYVFRLPAAEPVAPLEPASIVNDMVVRSSGQRAPIAGRWLHETDLNICVTLEKNAELPEHQGRSVRWVLANA